MFINALKKIGFFSRLHNRRTFVFFLLLVSSQLHLIGNEKTDSLFAVLKNLDQNNHRVDVLNLIATEVLFENHETAIKYSEEALKLAKKINYNNGAFEANYLLGKIHVNYTLNFSKAITYFTNALNFCKENDLEKKEQVFSQLAFINKRLGNFEKAIYYYQESLQMAQAQNKFKEISNLSGYLAEIYEETGDKKMVIFYLQNVMDIEKRTNFKNSSPVALVSIAHYYELRSQWAPAETYLLKALKIFENENNYRWQSYTYGLLSKIYVQKKNYLTAKEYADEGLKIATKHRLSKEIADNHYFLADVFDSLKDYKNAFIHFKALKNIDDSIFDIEKTKEIANIQSMYETAAKQENIEKANLEKELSESTLKKTQMVLIATLLVALLLIVLTVIIYKNYKIKQKVNLELENRDELRKLKLDEIIVKLNSEIIEHCETKTKLEIMNAELNNFMYSSSHDLKGPLAAIAGLTNLAVTEVSEKERMEYIALISKSAVRLSALIDDMVQTTKVANGNVELSTINFVKFVEAIIADIKNIESLKGVEFILDADKNLELVTDKNLFRTIMYNLIENGAKYRDTSRKASFVKISVKKDNNNLKISVADNGIGINENDRQSVFEMFSRFNPDLPGTGLGLYIVKKSVTKLGGKVYLNSVVGTGSTFEIELPDLTHFQLK